MRKRSGVPLNVLNLQEVVGIGGNIYMHILWKWDKMETQHMQKLST